MRPSTARVENADEVVSLSPDEEREIELAIAESDEDVRAGRVISWEQFVAERRDRRAGQRAE